MNKLLEVQDDFYINSNSIQTISIKQKEIVNEDGLLEQVKLISINAFISNHNCYYEITETNELYSHIKSFLDRNKFYLE